MKLKIKSSYLIKFLFGFFLIGLLVGFFLFFKLDTSAKESVILSLSNINSAVSDGHQNFIVMHLIISLFLTVLSLCVIGFPLVLFYLFFEFASFGFLLAGLIKLKGFNGLMFGLASFFINKFVYIVLLCYLAYVSFSFFRKIIKYKEQMDTRIFALHLKRLGIILLAIFINDLIIYFWGNKLLSIFLFLL